MALESFFCADLVGYVILWYAWVCLRYVPRLISHFRVYGDLRGNMS